MPEPIMETVTVTRKIDYRIAALIGFARSVATAVQAQLEDDVWMVQRANEYWDAQHGED